MGAACLGFQSAGQWVRRRVEGVVLRLSLPAATHTSRLKPGVDHRPREDATSFPEDRNQFHAEVPGFSFRAIKLRASLSPSLLV
jgi:hypothetical protein